jgi:D-aspartate ligase
MSLAEAPILPRRTGAVVLGGAHGSLEIARSLGRRGIPVWLVNADNPLAGFSRYVGRTLSWPGPAEDGAVEFLTDMARRHGIEGWALFAGGDDEVRFVAQNHAALATVFQLTTPSWDIARWAYDKRRMNARAAELGIAYPRTFYPRGCEDLPELPLPFPVILKPTHHDGRNDFADAKAWRADNPAALLPRYERSKALVGADSVMIQELIPGNGSSQHSYAAIWHSGRPVVSLVARRLRQYPIDFGFTSTFVETIEQPEVERLATRFLSSLDFSGLVEIEFKYDARDGAYKMLDVNARAWTWMGLGALAGIDFPLLQWQLATGAEIEPAAARLGACWMYFSRDLAASIHEIVAGRLSLAAYLRSLRRPSASAVFAWDDPWPALLDLPSSLARVIARGLSRRTRSAAKPLQSAKA